MGNEPKTRVLPRRRAPHYQRLRAITQVATERGEITYLRTNFRVTNRPWVTGRTKKTPERTRAPWLSRSLHDSTCAPADCSASISDMSLRAWMSWIVSTARPTSGNE